MDREIKFRGKRIDNQEWVYGYLIVDEIADKYYIFPNGNSCNEKDILRQEGLLHIFSYEVDEKTIGQYTNICDRNNVPIYEGDVIRFLYDVFTGNFDIIEGKGIIEFIGGGFYVRPFEIEGRKIEDTYNEEWYLLYSINTDVLKVIGNVYDDKKLLGE